MSYCVRILRDSLSCIVVSIFSANFEVHWLENKIEKKFADKIFSATFQYTAAIVNCQFFKLGQWERLVDCSYQERALRILEAWVSPSELHPSSLRTMIDLAYSTNFQHEAIAPVIKLNDQFFIQELFHGPTASFKDLALQLTPQFFSEGVSRKATSGEQVKYLILVATSGDTGSAVLEGFKGTLKIK